jgi:tetratricopeptide (TPR) repeat protein
MMFRSGSRWLLALAMVAIGGCPRSSSTSGSSSSATSTSPSASTPAAAPAREEGGWKPPASTSELRTTSAGIALRDLNGTIARLQRQIQDGRTQGQSTVQLVELLVLRASVLGRLADYDAAEELAEEMVRLAPETGEPLLARARVRSALHRFDEAMADLDGAEKLGFKDKFDPAFPRQLQAMKLLRAAALQGEGKLDQARTLARQQVESNTDRSSQLALALIEADLGHLAEADRLFVAAERDHKDVEPFSLALVNHRRGLMWEQAGNVEHARACYTAALARLGDYAPAVARMAALQALLGEREPAERALRQLITTSDDPEYQAQLAELLPAGAAETTKLIEQARQGFEALVKKHPAAFADHAARFFLGPGKDAARALQLASVNLENRRTPEAYQLVLRAALADGKTDRACAEAERVLGGKEAPSWLYQAAASAFDRCGKPDRATAARKSATLQR